MLRVLSFLFLLALLAVGFAWVADHPGTLMLTLAYTQYEVSLLTGLVLAIVFFTVLLFLWWVLRFVLHLPDALALSRQVRYKERLFKALSEGIIAASAGEVQVAQRASATVGRDMPDEPLTLLLRAQAAQLNSDRALAEQLFDQMAERPETRLLGLRGLHIEARRRGELDIANHYAEQAQERASVAWAGQALLEYYSLRADWDMALEVVHTNLSRGLIDKKTALRQQAVIHTAQAYALEEDDPERSLDYGKEAVRLAPDLVPALTLTARLMAKRGEIRPAAKMLDAGWRQIRHPDLGQTYVDLSPHDTAHDRIMRAEKLARIDPLDPESVMLIARMAIEAYELPKARELMEPLLSSMGGRPTRRMCLLMASLTKEEGRSSEQVEEWLTRAVLAPRDPAWVADGVIRDVWAPVVPETGKLDAFVWAVPDDHITHTLEAHIVASPPHELLPHLEQGLVAAAHSSTTPILPNAADLPEAAHVEVEEMSISKENLGQVLLPETMAEGSSMEDIQTPNSSSILSSGSSSPRSDRQKRARQLLRKELPGMSTVPTMTPVRFAHPSPPDDPGPKKG